MGVKYMPCIVSETVPGSPAWRAGLEPGDEIVKIGDRVNPTFVQLKGGVTLGDMENGIPIVVRRAADGEEVELTLKPEQSQGRGLATIGILNPWTVTLPRQIAGGAGFARRQGQASRIRRGRATARRPASRRRRDRPRRRHADQQTSAISRPQLAQSPGEPLQVTVERTAQRQRSGAADKAAATPRS